MTIGVVGGIAWLVRGSTPEVQVSGFALPRETAGNWDLNGIVAGPDGNLWFTEGDANSVARLTTTGAVTEYGIPTAASGPGGIAVGPDGNLWFAEVSANKVASMTTRGVFTEYALPAGTEFMYARVAAGLGGIWFTIMSSGQPARTVARISTQGAVTEYSPPSDGSDLAAAYDIAAGPDGSIWFTDYSKQCNVVRMTSPGVMTEYPAPHRLQSPFDIGECQQDRITSGSDSSVWLIDPYYATVTKVTTSGGRTQYTIPDDLAPGATATDIAPGPNGSVWVIMVDRGVISSTGGFLARITSAGKVTEYSYGNGFRMIVAADVTLGPDQNLWCLVGPPGKIRILKVSTPRD